MAVSVDADFHTLHLRPGVRLHLRPTRRFKSVWIDAYLARPLKPRFSTRLALLGRLLERGTRQLPDLCALNRYTDWLYGASLSATAEGLGAFQALRLHYDAVDPAYLADPGQDLLAAGFRLLGDVLHDPYLEGEGFPEERVRQECQALARYVGGLYVDRTLWAQRRCLQHMCAGSPYALAAHGEPRELGDVDGAGLYQDLRHLLDAAPMDIYLCGDFDAERVVGLATTHLARDHAPGEPPPPPVHVPSGAPRRVVEAGDVSQGRLLLGFHTPMGIAGAMGDDYPALLLLNLLFGADVHSRLYTRVREAEGLVYHIASYTEPMAGMVLVEAGVDPGDCQTVVDLVEAQLRELREGGPDGDELERTRVLARRRLQGFEDGRESLVRFHYYRRLAGTEGSRRGLLDLLDRVTPGQVAAAARALDLDTVYYLAPAGSVA